MTSTFSGLFKISHTTRCRSCDGGLRVRMCEKHTSSHRVVTCSMGASDTTGALKEDAPWSQASASSSASASPADSAKEDSFFLLSSVWIGTLNDPKPLAVPVATAAAVDRNWSLRSVAAVEAAWECKLANARSKPEPPRPRRWFKLLRFVMSSARLARLDCRDRSSPDPTDCSSSKLMPCCAVTYTTSPHRSQPTRAVSAMGFRKESRRTNTAVAEKGWWTDR